MVYYDKLIPGTYKSDLVRLLLLYKYGGIYVDCGSECLLPIDNYISKDDEFVTSIDYVCNQFIKNTNGLTTNFICATKNHPLIKIYIDHIIFNIHNKIYGSNWYYPTGPTLFYEIVCQYLKIKKISRGIIKNLRFLVTPKTKDNCFNNNEENKNICLEDVYIVSGNKRIIRKKFKGYNEEIKSNKKTHYKKYWSKKNIYK